MTSNKVIPLHHVANAFANLAPRTELREKYGYIVRLSRTYESSTRTWATVYFDWFDYMSDKTVLVRKVYPRRPGKYQYRRAKMSVEKGTMELIEVEKEVGESSNGEES